jgi:hypothetical protein
LKAQDSAPNKSVSMQGDPVHPGPPGQLMMTAALLKALGADGFVSSVSLDAAGSVTEAKGCSVTDARAENRKLIFDRLDECLPFPIPDDARAVLPLAPQVAALSRYLLKVTGLKDGSYLLKIGGVPVAHVSTRGLSDGINLSALPDSIGRDANPLLVQGRAILGAVAAKESIVNSWRSLSQRAHAPNAPPELKDQLAALTRKVEEADGKIREAARPKKIRFELEPVQ